MRQSSVSGCLADSLTEVTAPTEPSSRAGGKGSTSLEKTSRVRVRKRVPRACEGCRRRKVKCDGKEVCHGCLTASIECIYQSVSGERMMKDHMQSFDTRLQNLEDTFTEILTRLNNQTTPSGPRPSTSGSVSNPLLSRPTPTSTSDPFAELVSNGEGYGVDEANKIANTLISLGKAKQQFYVECQPTKPQSSSSQERTHTEKRGKQHEPSHLTYADAYGELRLDGMGQLRYIGLGSTLRLIDVCPPFRRHLEMGLEQKGYENSNSVFDYPRRATNSGKTPYLSRHEATSPFNLETLPPKSLTSVLIDLFYERLYFILPIITRSEFETQFAASTSEACRKSEFVPVFYGVLAMAALSLPSDHEVYEEEHLARYKEANLAALFFESSVACTSQQNLWKTNRCPTRSLNGIIALTLQTAYMASIGSQAEAWILVGQVARLGQDIGLHRCPVQLGFKRADQERRKSAWWCIYSLDRTLSSALGRPFAIRDTDGDIELPPTDSLEPESTSEESSGFYAILRLRQILGSIVDTVASVRKVKDTRAVSRIPELRAAVVKLNSELQTWSTVEVPQHIKSAEKGSNRVERLIALSTYFSAVMLLYRYLVPNPHRPSPLRGSEALAQCARAATNCIQITSSIIDSLPVCPDLIFHAQHVFTASMSLLHCIRRSDDTKFIQGALKDVELAQRFLRSMQHIWTGANNLTSLLEEYLEFILHCLEKGLDSERCAFHHEEHEATGLEWREATVDNASTWLQPSSTPMSSPLKGIYVPYEPRVDSFRSIESRANGIPLIPRSQSTLTESWRLGCPHDPIHDGDFGRAWNLDSVDRSFDNLLSGDFDATFNLDF